MPRSIDTLNGHRCRSIDDLFYVQSARQVSEDFVVGRLVLKNVLAAFHEIVLFVVHFHEALVIVCHGRLDCGEVLVIGVCDGQDSEAATLAIPQTRVIFFPLLRATRLRIHPQDSAVTGNQHSYQKSLWGFDIFIQLTEQRMQQSEVITNLNPLRHRIHCPQLRNVCEWGDSPHDLNCSED